MSRQTPGKSDSLRLRLSTAWELRFGRNADRCPPNGAPLQAGDSERDRRQAVRDVLGNRDFRLLWLGQLLSQVGDQCLLIASVTLISGFSTSALALSIPAVLIALPQLVFGLVGGVMADRWNRRRTMVRSDLLRGLIVLAVLLVGSAAHLWILYLAAAALALVAAFFYPARNAAIPNLVPPEQLLAANGLIQGSYVFALIAGSLIAGIAVELWMPAAIILDSATFFISAIFIGMMRAPMASQQARVVRDSGVWEDMKAGLRFIRGHPVLVRVLMVTAAATLGIGAIVILAVPHLKEQLGAGGLVFGVAMGMLGVGSVMGGLLASRLSQWLSTTSIVSGMLILAGVAIIAFAYASSYVVVLISVAVVGACIVLARGSLDTISQALSPDEMCGRVQSAVNMLVVGGMALAEGISGVLGDLLGVQVVFVAAGLITGLTGVVAGFVLRGTGRMVAEAGPR
jgi:DHA3 family macrolide efflux protein-like MFS transporter